MNPSFLVYRSSRESYGCFVERFISAGKNGVKATTKKTTIIVKKSGRHFDITLSKVVTVERDNGEGLQSVQSSSVSVSRRTRSKSDVSRLLHIVPRSAIVQTNIKAA